MKYVLILGLLALVVAFLYVRLRPYLKVAREVFGFVRDVRRMGAGVRPGAQAQGEARAAGERLARCAACGTWLPASRALTLRTGATYCSTACLERAAEPSRDAHKSAS